MTKNNAAQAAEQAIKAAIRKAYDDGYNDAKMAPDNCSTYCVERAVRLDSAVLLSKLRAPVADERDALMRAIVKAGQDAGIIRADLETVSGPECLHILECLVSAPVAGDKFTHNDDCARYLASAPIAGEALTRFCPECSHVGDVGSGYRSCCPDGGSARMVPKSLADKCRATFQLAIKSDAAPQASEAVRDAEAWLIEWKPGDGNTWVEADANEVRAREKAQRVGGTVTSMVRAALSAQSGAQRTGGSE